MDTKQITILIDQRVVECESGVSVASVLLSQGQYAFSRHPVDLQPRGPFCMIGACQSCRVLIEGQMRLACQVVVRPELRIQLHDDNLPAQHA